jgi:hypothetical protein
VLAPSYRGLRGQTVEGVRVHRFRYAPRPLGDAHPRPDGAGPDPRAPRLPGAGARLRGGGVAGGGAAGPERALRRAARLLAPPPRPDRAGGEACVRGAAGLHLLRGGAHLDGARPPLPRPGAAPDRARLRRGDGDLHLHRGAAAAAGARGGAGDHPLRRHGGAGRGGRSPAPAPRAARSSCSSRGGWWSARGCTCCWRRWRGSRTGRRCGCTWWATVRSGRGWRRARGSWGSASAPSSTASSRARSWSGAWPECDAFVLPAVVDAKGDTEGLGVVLLEAMSYGKPTIASAAGGIVDIVRDGRNGSWCRRATWRRSPARSAAWRPTPPPRGPWGRRGGRTCGRGSRGR